MGVAVALPTVFAGSEVTTLAIAWGQLAWMPFLSPLSRPLPGVGFRLAIRAARLPVLDAISSG